MSILYKNRIPKGDWFLAIVARNNILLAAILESRYNSAISCKNDNDFENGFTPSPFYIEEIQDTLEHLRIVGIENLANTWVLYNKRPQVGDFRNLSLYIYILVADIVFLFSLFWDPFLKKKKTNIFKIILF